MAIRVVAGALLRGRRVLVALRGKGMRMPGFWELPGGKVEPGETDAAALRRELDEELGIEVEVGERLGEALHGTPPDDVHLVAYACRLSNGRPHARQHSSLRWVGPDELDSLRWAPADRDLLRRLKTILRRGSTP